MRIVVLGGFGNFGARICRALAPDPSLTVVAASLRSSAVPADFALLNIQDAQIDITVHVARHTERVRPEFAKWGMRTHLEELH